jgi:hypothetical protein
MFGQICQIWISSEHHPNFWLVLEIRSSIQRQIRGKKHAPNLQKRCTTIRISSGLSADQELCCS